MNQTRTSLKGNVLTVKIPGMRRFKLKLDRESLAMVRKPGEVATAAPTGDILPSLHVCTVLPSRPRSARRWLAGFKEKHRPILRQPTRADIDRLVA